jgi:PDZ domain-containing secreted protein
LSQHTVSLLGITVDSNMSIIRLFPDSVLAGRLEPGDVINFVDDNGVKSPEELTAATASLTKGTKVKISFLRGGLWLTWIFVQL